VCVCVGVAEGYRQLELWGAGTTGLTVSHHPRTKSWDHQNTILRLL